MQRYLCPPCPCGEGGHLDLLWFPVTQICVGVHPCLHPCLCQSLFTWYFQQFFADGFQILRYGDHEQGLELINLLWLWLNFHGHRVHYVSKSTLFTRYMYVLQVFANCFQILWYCDHEQDLEFINFSRLGLDFQGYMGFVIFKLTLFTQYFLQFFFLMAFRFLDVVAMNKALNWLTFCDCDSCSRLQGVIMFQN